MAVLIVVACVVSYLFIGWLSGCIAIRWEWSHCIRKGKSFKPSDTRACAQFFWPLFMPFFIIYMLSQRDGRGRLTNYLSTPTRIRKQQRNALG